MIDSGSGGVWSLLAGLALGSAACGGLDGAAFNGREVQLGTASGSSRDLGGCTAEGCGANPGDLAALDEGGFPTCRPIAMDAIEIAWQQALYDAEYEPVQLGDCGATPRCAFEVTAMAAATDGSLWVAGQSSPVTSPVTDEDAVFYSAPRAMWLAHHASDGLLLGYRIVEMETLVPTETVTYQVALAAGQDGHMVLAVDKELGKEGFFEPERTLRLEEFAPDGAPVAAPTTLGGDRRPGYMPPLLAAAGGGALVIVSGDRIALMDADRSLRWVQAGTGMAQTMASDSRQQVSLALMPVSDDAGEIQHYDASGRRLWRRALATNADARVDVDQGGNVVRFGREIEYQEFTPGSTWSPDNAISEMLVHKISPGGESIWGLRFSVPGTAGGSGVGSGVARDAVIDASNRIWMLGAAVWNEARQASRARFYEISPDGDRCAEHEINGTMTDFQILVPIPGGGLYALWRDGYGRLEL